jgi:hypothetical protein
MTFRPDLAGLSKATRNERRKLRSTFLNNIAVGFVLAGFATPFVNSLWTSSSGGGPLSLSSTIIVVAIDWACAFAFHWAAMKTVSGLED